MVNYVSTGNYKNEETLLIISYEPIFKSVELVNYLIMN
jgi:hypothetical protein